MDALLAECERLGLLAVGQLVEIRFTNQTKLRLRVTGWTATSLDGTDPEGRRRYHPQWADMQEVHQA